MSGYSYFNDLRTAAVSTRNNAALVKEYVQTDAWNLAFAEWSVRANREVVEAAVRNDPTSFRFAAPHLKADEVRKSSRYYLLYESELTTRIQDFLGSLCEDHPWLICLADPGIRDDPSAFTRIAWQASEVVQFMGANVRGNKEAIRELCKAHYRSLQYASDELRRDKEFVAELVTQHNYTILECCADELRRDKNFMLSVVDQVGTALKYASDALRNDPEVVSAAVAASPTALAFASEELRGDADYMLSVLEVIDPECADQIARFASDELRSDPVLMTAICDCCPSALAYASYDLRSDPDWLVSVMHINESELLKWTDKALLADPEFLIDAIREGWWAIKYASDSLLENKSFMRQAILEDTLQPSRGKRGTYHNAMTFCSPKLRRDAEFMKQVVQLRSTPQDFLYSANELQKDPEFVMFAVSRNGLTFEHVHDDLKKNRKLALAAVKQNGLAVKFLLDSQKQDKEIALCAVKQNGLSLEVLPHEHKYDIDIARAAIEQNSSAFRFAGESLKNNEEFAQFAVEQDGANLKHVGYELKTNRKIAAAALLKDGRAVEYLISVLQKDEDFVLEVALRLSDAKDVTLKNLTNLEYGNFRDCEAENFRAFTNAYEAIYRVRNNPFVRATNAVGVMLSRIRYAGAVRQWWEAEKKGAADADFFNMHCEYISFAAVKSEQLEILKSKDPGVMEQVKGGELFVLSEEQAMLFPGLGSRFQAELGLDEEDKTNDDGGSRAEDAAKATLDKDERQKQGEDSAREDEPKKTPAGVSEPPAKRCRVDQ